MTASHTFQSFLPATGHGTQSVVVVDLVLETKFISFGQVFERNLFLSTSLRATLNSEGWCVVVSFTSPPPPGNKVWAGEIRKNPKKLRKKRTKYHANFNSGKEKKSVPFCWISWISFKKSVAPCALAALPNIFRHSRMEKANANKYFFKERKFLDFSGRLLATLGGKQDRRHLLLYDFLERKKKGLGVFAVRHVLDCLLNMFFFTCGGADRS